MSIRKFKRTKKILRLTEGQKEIVRLCNLARPHLHETSRFRTGQCVYQNKLLSAILHKLGKPTNVVSGETVLLCNGNLSIDHRDAFDGTEYFWKGSKISLAKGTGGFPISHHTWLVSENNFVIDISVDSYPDLKMDLLYGLPTQGFPKIQRDSTLSSILKQAEKCNSNKTVWSYREYEQDEYLEHADIMDKHLNHDIGVKWLKINSNELIDEWLLSDDQEIYRVNEISDRIRDNLKK